MKIAAPAALAEQIQALADKVDLLCARDDWSEHAGDGTAARSGEMASIHAMLRSLAEKVDQVGIRSEHEGPRRAGEAGRRRWPAGSTRRAAPIRRSPASSGPWATCCGR